MRRNENRNPPTRDEAWLQRQIAKIFGTGGKFVPLSLAGWSSSANNGSSIDILLLSDAYDDQRIKKPCNKYLESQDSKNEYINALPIPLPPNDSSSIRLLSRVYTSIPLSKTKMLLLNSLLVNRDRGLFDNLPWATWTIDPQYKVRDAANKRIDDKYSTGKQVAYQRFMGKEWQGGLSK
jgi:hypothetical protein